jgi:ribose transport system permease protein
LGYLEDRLRPPPELNPVSRDMMGLGLLVAMAAILVPAWNTPGRYSADTPALFTLYCLPLAAQMASYCLPVALGFLLALRCGAVDLSVWVNAGVGGLVAAALIRAGAPAGWAIAAGAAAGLLLGALNGAIVVGLRVPSPIATLATAVGASWGAQSLVGARAILLSEALFAGWQATLIAAGVYAMALLVLIAGQRAEHAPISHRRELFLSLCGSGLLAALGGIAWIIDQHSAPTPTQVIGDLRVPAAAILAGGWLLRGRARGLLAGAALPAALLVATIWQQGVWYLQRHAVAIQTLFLLAMLLVAQGAMNQAARSGRSRKVIAILAAFLASGGILILCASLYAHSNAGRFVVHACGLVVWAAGAALLLLARRPRKLTA